MALTTRYEPLPNGDRYEVREKDGQVISRIYRRKQYVKERGDKYELHEQDKSLSNYTGEFGGRQYVNGVSVKAVTKGDIEARLMDYAARISGWRTLEQEAISAGDTAIATRCNARAAALYAAAKLAANQYAAAPDTA